MVTETSLQAWDGIKDNLGFKQRAVYAKLKEIQPATDVMIAKALHWPINTVTPRRGELAQKFKMVGVAFVGKNDQGRSAIFWKVVR